jgi:hypothetical protein
MIPVEEPTNRYNGVIQNQVLKHGHRGIHYAMGWLELFELIATLGIISTESLSGRPPDLLDYKGPPLDLSSAGVPSTKTHQNKGNGRLKSTMLQGSTSTRAKKKQHTNKPTLPTSTALQPKTETSMSTATLKGLLSNPTC